MKHSFKQSALVLALATFTGVAFAQSSTSPPSGSSPSAAPTTSGSQGSTMGSQGSSATGSQGSTMGSQGSNAARMPSSKDTADSAWRTLDSSNRGYLQRNDVSGLSGFSFDSADTNRDGRVSKEEFARAWGTKN